MLKSLCLLLLATSWALGQNDYSAKGPYATRSITRLSFKAPTSTDCNKYENRCSVTLDAILPSASGAFPLIVYSVGFSQSRKDYESFGLHAASWGYTTLFWDPDEGALGGITQHARGKVAAYIVEWAFLQSASSSSPLFGKVDTSKSVIQSGHSLGGKSALLASIYEPRISGLVLMDPVDCPPPMPPGIPYSEDNPNAIAMMDQSKADGAFIGAELGDIGELIPCAPVSCNYQKYYANATSPAWEVMVVGAGHSQWLDGTRSGGRGGCGAGPAETDIVQMISRTILVAWAQFKVYGEDISYWTSKWIQDMKAKNYVDYRLK